MSTLLAIDPALRALGWALFDSGTLIRCGVARSEEKYPALHMAAQVHSGIRGYPVHPRVIVEIPEVYPSSPPAKDLIDITVVGAYVAGEQRPIDFIQVTPRKWKGNLSKDETERRSSEVLSYKELQAPVAGLKGIPKGLHNNAWDAIALGLWQLRRVQLA